MKIIQKGNARPEATHFCNYCNAELSFTKSDVYPEHKTTYIDYGDVKDILDSFWEYYIYCPCCKHKEEVSYLVSDWFE